MIADMESQLANMKNSLAAIKRTPKEKEKKKEKREKPPPPAASTSKAPPKQAKAPPAPKASKKSKKPIADDDVLTFEQKKDLSDTIGKLDGSKLEKVIQIIHEGVPEIRDVRSAFFLSERRFHRLIRSHRAPKRSSSRSTRYLPPSSPSSTTLSFDR